MRALNWAPGNLHRYCLHSVCIVRELESLHCYQSFSWPGVHGTCFQAWDLSIQMPFCRPVFCDVNYRWHLSAVTTFLTQKLHGDFQFIYVNHPTKEIEAMNVQYFSTSIVVLAFFDNVSGACAY